MRNIGNKTKAHPAREKIANSSPRTQAGNPAGNRQGAGVRCSAVSFDIDTLQESGDLCRRIVNTGLLTNNFIDIIVNFQRQPCRCPFASSSGACCARSPSSQATAARPYKLPAASRLARPMGGCTEGGGCPRHPQRDIDPQRSV